MWRSQYEICRRNTKLMGSLLCLMKKKGEKERCSLREKWVTNDSPDTNAAVTVLSNSVHLPLWKQPSLPLFFFHLKYSLYPALSVIPFCKTENHLLSSVSLYLKKKIIMLNISAHSIFSSHLARLSLPWTSSILCSFFILKQKFLNGWTSFERVRVYVWFTFTEKRKKRTYFWKLAFTGLPDPPL